MRVEQLRASVFRVPTDAPSADGTARWEETTVVVVEAVSDSGLVGTGYTYGEAAAAALVTGVLAGAVVGRDVAQVRGAWRAMVASLRNAGRPGIGATAVSAVDVALWDLRARAAGQPLFEHLGAARSEVPVYGSGGLTSYTQARLVEQLSGWAEAGIPRLKMKVGKDWGQSQEEDLARAAAVRSAVGPGPELFVDANGAYTAKQAVRLARRFGELGVTYFEEPVSADDLPHLAAVRAQTALDVAAGEYGYGPWYFQRMLSAGAVDILQADATRCLGVTGWMMAADLAYAAQVPFSAHCAPALHAQLGCAAPQISHLEYFHDHVRVESMLFEGAPAPQGGSLRPDPAQPGLGLRLKTPEAERWRAA
ncbi:MAG: enolase C-terminal domain-like protein [Candidatus Dormibacterales bacterium]